MPKSLSATKHFQLAQILREQIRKMQPGEELPSVIELKQAHGVSQATVDHLVASVPQKADNAQAFLDAAKNMSAFRIVPKYIEWEAALWNEYFTPLLNKQTDLTPEELAKEVRPDLEALLPGEATATPSS